jgi:ASC-1-like (ASCH) protein
MSGGHHFPLWAIIALVLLVVLALVAVAVIAARRRAVGILGGGPFRLKVSDPEYTALLEGKKTVEARLDRPPFDRLKEDDPVTVVRARARDDTSEYPGGRYKYDTTVARVTRYGSFDALLKGESLSAVYPGKDAAEAKESFERFLPEGETASSAVLAIELVPPEGGKKAAKKAKPKAEA